MLSFFEHGDRVLLPHTCLQVTPFVCNTMLVEGRAFEAFLVCMCDRFGFVATTDPCMSTLGRTALEAGCCAGASGRSTAEHNKPPESAKVGNDLLICETLLMFLYVYCLVNNLSLCSLSLSWLQQVTCPKLMLWRSM